MRKRASASSPVSRPFAPAKREIGASSHVRVIRSPGLPRFYLARRVHFRGLNSNWATLGSAMSKSATLEANPESTPAKRSRKPRRASSDASDSFSLAKDRTTPSAFPTKPLLVGVGIGAALAFTAVALGSRPARVSHFAARPPSVAGAFAKTAVVLLARVVARRALAAAANRGARRLANSWPL